MPHYLYNGIEFPALPETHQYAPDGVVFDYAVIYKHLGLDTIYLKLIDKPLLAYHESIMDNRLSLRPLPVTEPYWEYEYKLNGNKWEDMGTFINPDHVTGDLAAVQGVDPQGVWYQNDLMWSNHDIMDSENGGVYFKGSEPKSLPTPQDFYLIKTVGSKTYLYNGIELPALPNWDKTKYPYVHIERYYNRYDILMTTKPMYYGTVPSQPNQGSVLYSYYGSGEEVSFLIATRDGGSWGDITENTRENNVPSGGRYFLYSNTLNVGVWTNHDIPDTDDGGVHLPASDPIPKTTAQKQDVYLRVGGQWVKQEEYLS